MSIEDLFRCICRGRNCQEKGHINWDRNLCFTHIRIDGCVVKSSATKRCDCLILYFPEENSKMVMFFIECKPRGYSIDEVKEQIETSIKTITQCYSDINKSVIVPVCYAESHSSSHNRTIASYKVATPKGPLGIKLLNYEEDICKALR